jgi:hypothetical protein
LFQRVALFQGEPFGFSYVHNAIQFFAESGKVTPEDRFCLFGMHSTSFRFVARPTPVPNPSRMS